MCSRRTKSALILLIFLLAACSSGPDQLPATIDEIDEPPVAASTVRPEPTPTTNSTPTSLPTQPATVTVVGPLESTTATIEPTVTPGIDPTAVIAEATKAPEIENETSIQEPLLPIGSTANWTTSADIIGIEGLIEVIAADQIRIVNFVSLVSEAPGVDIRLGVGRDFEDGIGVSLKDITGQEYDGRNLTLAIPSDAFDGRTFDSIGVFCYDTGDLFDYALFESP